ncbi:MAG TPA: threonine--tRNA ligase [Ktedonobacterales bacterium]|jgi:threonyl-tRNA synthetase|nr:threonine--tRNA ligase [Ktedonobacterales bacterium]
MSVEEELNSSVEYTPIQRMRHSAAHVMAEAIQELLPGTKFAIGPAVEDGFYYDMETPRPLSPEDFPAIEERMRASIAANHPFEQSRWPREKALDYFKQHDQPYKIEIIENLQDAEVGIYQQGPFLDLCRGPHVERTGQIGPIKLMRTAGAYWRGDEHRPMLTRVYGTAWNTQEELDAYLERLEEARKRDHRRLGKDLELFMISDEIGAGLPVWLPNGATIRRILERYIVDVEEKAGYQHVYTPNLAKLDLYKTSGHWEHYHDSMYPPMDMGNGEELVLRPMNCPDHIVIYKSKMRSYRDLPVRIAELGTMYRLEKSGELSGLSRVRAMTLNDAHIFCTPDQMLNEFIGAVKLIQETYKVLGFERYSYRLSLRDPNDKVKFEDNEEMWQKSEAALRQALDQLHIDYYEGIGDAAFYGPKLDVQVANVLGKDETISTVQLDFTLPERFKLEYIGEDGQPHRPVMIHRGVLSTMERIVAFLIENYAGAFPVWLAPVQALVIPISDEKHGAYANAVLERLQAAGMRAEVDNRKERMNAKVRDAQLRKIPYMLVVGDKEAAANAVSLRLRSNENVGAIPLDEFLAQASALIANRSLELWTASAAATEA